MSGRRLTIPTCEASWGAKSERGCRRSRRSFGPPSLALVTARCCPPWLTRRRRQIRACSRRLSGWRLPGASRRPASAGSWLPAAHTAGEHGFAQRLEAFVEDPSADRLSALRHALDLPAGHQLDLILRGTEHVEARLMAARLCTWLLGRKLRPSLPQYGTAWQPAVESARRYAEEGGYLDWARQALRGMRGASAPLDSAARRLLAKIDAEARDDDRRFAEAYVSWLEAGKPSTEIVPIEHVAKRVVAAFLNGKPHRRLLVVVMDGMSQAAAMQLLNRLQEQRRWRPLAWRAPGWKGNLPLPPVLAVAPTCT